MRFTKCFIVLSLSLLIGACVFGKGDLEIDIGDYENHLAAWNSQNLLDYQINVDDNAGHIPRSAIIRVKNGIPYNDGWKMGQSTIPGFYFLIKDIEKDFRNALGSGGYRSRSLKASYDTFFDTFHYPSEIIAKVDGHTTVWYKITLTSHFEINAGDYEKQLSAWNTQNMLDYYIRIGYWNKRDDQGRNYLWTDGANFYVKNGIPFLSDSDDDRSLFNFENKKTVPEFYSFIKEEEERIRNEYDWKGRWFLDVEYDTEYHYPKEINWGVSSGREYKERWGIVLTFDVGVTGIGNGER